MNKTRISVLLVLFFIIGIGIGYSYGFTQGVKLAITFGLEFVDLDIDEHMLTTAVTQYKDQIGSCLFTQNASIYDNTWNQEGS